MMKKTRKKLKGVSDKIGGVGGPMENNAYVQVRHISHRAIYVISERLRSDIFGPWSNARVLQTATVNTKSVSLKRVAKRRKAEGSYGR